MIFSIGVTVGNCGDSDSALDWLTLFVEGGCLCGF